MLKENHTAILTRNSAFQTQKIHFSLTGSFSLSPPLVGLRNMMMSSRVIGKAQKMDAAVSSSMCSCVRITELSNSITTKIDEEDPIVSDASLTLNCVA